MGARGPKPEPAAIKRAKGNPGRRAVGVDPAVDSVEKAQGLTAPEWINAAGREIWGRLAPKLEAMNLLSGLDVETFGRYCQNFGRWLKMQARLDSDGETYLVESEHGKYVRANPAYLIADRLERQLVAAEAGFGLNPAERQRIYAARAAGKSQGELFGGAAEAPAKSAPAAKPVESGPVGLLN